MLRRYVYSEKLCKREDIVKTESIFRKSVFLLVLVTGFLLPGSGLAQPPPSMSGGGASPGGFQNGPQAGSFRSGQNSYRLASAQPLEEVEQSVYFTDLNRDTAKINAYVDYLFARKVLTDPEGKKLFHPDAQLTRGDYALMLFGKYRYARTGREFRDVSPDAYYAEAVNNGRACGIFDHTIDFHPDRSVTREDVILWAFRSERQNGMPTSMVSDDVFLFKDGFGFSRELGEAVGTFAAIRLIQPDADGKYGPELQVRRGEIVKFLYRLSLLGSGSTMSQGTDGKPPGGPGGGPPGGMGGFGGPGGPVE